MNKINKVIVTSLFVNGFLSIGKVLFGVIGKSGALIVDGIHSFSDLVTDVISGFGHFISKKPADEKHPFGHGKSEYITSMIIGCVVLFLGLNIIYNSFSKSIVIPSLYMAIVSLATIIIKFLLAFYITKKGKEYHNNILIASGRESSADVISSLVVLISILLMQLSTSFPILKYADRIAIIIVGILIVNIGFSILKENISIILGEQETNKEYIANIEAFLLEHEQVKKIDSFHLLKYGPYYKLNAELSLQWDLSLMEAHHLIDHLEKDLQEWDDRIQYITIHMGPYIEEKKELS